MKLKIVIKHKGECNALERIAKLLAQAYDDGAGRKIDSRERHQVQQALAKIRERGAA